MHTIDCPICKEPLGQFVFEVRRPNGVVGICGPCNRQYELVRILATETKADRQRRRRVKTWLEETAGGDSDVR